MIGAVNEPNSKQAEIDYPITIGEEGRTWLRNKPFWHEPRMTARLLIDKYSRRSGLTTCC